MPSLELDVPARYDIATKKTIARRFGQSYAKVMMTTPDIVTVSIHDLGEGSVWRCTDDEPISSALIMADVRSGRDEATRAALAQALIADCVDVLDLDPLRIKIEFTQHPGNEMYHPQRGGFNTDWVGSEA